jgi:hypothetical protein
MSAAELRAAAEAYSSAQVDTLLGAKLNLTGGTLTGALSLISGSAGSPSINFGTANTGFYGNSNSFLWANGGFAKLSYDSGYTLWLRDNAGNIALGDAVDVRLHRGPTGGILHQRNGLNAQTYELFETYTSSTNYGSLCLKATASGHQIGSARGTSGSNRAVQLGHFDAAGNFTSGLSVATNGAVTFAAAIIGSINGIGVPVGGNGFNFQGSGFFTCASSGVFTFQDGAATSFGRLQLGGTTDAFPSIKRNGTAINFRLANDSADCPITAAAITASGAITPATLTDAAAPNGSIYFSSTASRLVYKDSGGTVNNLY